MSGRMIKMYPSVTECNFSQYIPVISGRSRAARKTLAMGKERPWVLKDLLLTGRILGLHGDGRQWDGQSFS